MATRQLPPGWQKVFDETYKRDYYYHAATQESLWVLEEVFAKAAAAPLPPPPRAAPPMPMPSKQLRLHEVAKIFVGGLSYDFGTPELRAAFTRFGMIMDCIVIMDRATNQSKGFGFVTFSNATEAANARAAMDKSMLGGRQINVNPPTHSGGGGGGGGRPMMMGGGGYGPPGMGMPMMGQGRMMMGGGGMRRPPMAQQGVKLFVGQLSWGTTGQMLKEAFEGKMGITVLDATVVMERDDPQVRCRVARIVLFRFVFI